MDNNIIFIKNITNPIRFDLMAKVLYIKYQNIDFFIKLYKRHIIVFNNAIEFYGTKKNGIDQFVNCFNDLINSIENNGFKGKIPLNKQELIEDGAHRLSTCYVKNIIPEFEFRNSNINIGGYNYTYFSKLEEAYKDRMALEYVKLSEKIRSMIIFPIGNKNIKKDDIKNTIKKYGQIYYEKDILLTKNGLENLIKECYRGEKWVGGLFPKDVNGKLNPCYFENIPITLLILHLEEDKYINLKKECRSFAPTLGNHSLHISDGKIDTFRITSSLLNKNSLFFLNNGTNNISELNKKRLSDYFNKIQNSKEDYCLTSSIILEFFNLRNANDIDYLNINDYNINIKNIDVHKGKWLDYYDKDKANLINDPNNHFYINGFKILTLDTILKMKLKRSENKDIKDIELIKKYI